MKGIQAPANVKYALIHEALSGDGNLLNISELCQIACVSRSGYYAWLKAAPKRQRREEQDMKDFALVQEAYQFRGYKKGARSIHMRLLHQKPPITNREINEKIRAFLPNSSGKSLSPDGESNENQPCGKECHQP